MPKANPATTSPPTPTSTGSGATPISSTGSTPPTVEPEAAAPPTPPVDPLDIRYTADSGVPDWLVGKSAKDAALITQQMYNQMVQMQLGNNQPFSLDQPAPALAPQMPPIAPPVAPDPHARNDMLGMLGAQARALAEIQYKDDFKRWGPEIDMALNVVPPAQRTPQVVDWIVRGVRGSHVHELTNEIAEAKLKQLVESGQLRPQNADQTGGGAAWSQVDFEKLPPRYRAVLQNLGVNVNTVDEFLRQTNPNIPIAQAREQFMKKAEQGDVITDGVSKFMFEGSSHG